MIKYLTGCFLLILSSCIGDDLIFDTVEPEVRIANPIDTLQLGSSYQFEFTFLNNVGIEEELTIFMWESSFPDIINIDQNGLATAVQNGMAVIKLTGWSSDTVRHTDEHPVVVGGNTVLSSPRRTGSLKTSSSYLLQGDFSLEKVEGGVQLSLQDNYQASTALPGLYVYLTNNPNSIDNAFEIGAVKIFRGAHSYLLEDIEVNQYSHLLYFCKPFRVKVGDGAFDN